MRVRILRDFYTSNGRYHAGDIVYINRKKAKDWIRVGLAMQDKSLDGADEVKTR